MINTILGGGEYLELAKKLIREGEVVAFPTETVYGLGADAFNATAIAQVYRIKGRPNDNPFIVHIGAKDDLESVAKNIPNVAYELMDMFFPGPLTLVLKKKATLPDITTANLNTVGVRMPNHPLALEFIRACKCPIAAPSANMSKHISATSAMHVMTDLGGKIPLILDGGKSNIGIESTVVSLVENIPFILRPGAITRDELMQVLPDVQIKLSKVDKPASPGMKYAHYMPSCPTVCVCSQDVAKRIYSENIDKSPVIIASDHFLKECSERNTISLGETERSAMQLLFSSLRTAEMEFKYIILEYFPKTTRYEGINNRIEKASSGIIITN
ncbi:MAG: threonylcarbamoyl-AMP synthase [Christensenellaceae bacterium]|jgi:L-threonylcarbamoyladenylate synthase|nr:threonylcarbamoyl-AMP synthase [Christensenellaceae bacterium]